MIADFITNVSQLPSVSVDEIATLKHFECLYPDHVPVRRRWLEMAQVLRDAGWRHSRARSLIYKGPGNYVSGSGSRWFPPTADADTTTPTD
jgi:hypothetical protein